mgnify:CR=1 FL=1
MSRTKFQTYQNFYDDFKRCRSPIKGRPINGWSRLYKEDRDYVVKLVQWRAHDIEVFRVSPDNTITFTAPLDLAVRYSNTLVASLWRVVPLTMWRKRAGIYCIRSISGWSDKSKLQPEYFGGIKFNLETGECLNPQPDMMDMIIPEKRKQWLRGLRKLKKGLKIRAKLGAFEGVIRTVDAERFYHGNSQYNNGIPKWDSPDITELVLECMRTEEYPHELLKLLAQTANLGWGMGDTTSKQVMGNVDRVFDTHSLHYRKAYGVFGETLHAKS